MNKTIKLILRLIPLLTGIILYYSFGNESRSIMLVISLITILVGWFLFYFFIFRNNSKILNTKGLIILFSLLSMIGTTVLIEKIAYGADVSSISKTLNSNSPTVISVIEKETFQNEMRIKRKDISAAWVYEYSFYVNNKKYNGSSFYPYKAYNIGDTIKIAYYIKNPKVNKIIKN